MIAIVTTTFIMQNEFADQLLGMRHTSVHHGANFDLTSRITFSHRILSETIQGVKRLKQGIMLWQKVSAGFNKSGIGLDPAGYNGASITGRGTYMASSRAGSKKPVSTVSCTFLQVKFLEDYCNLRIYRHLYVDVR